LPILSVTHTNTSGIVKKKKKERKKEKKTIQTKFSNRLSGSGTVSQNSGINRGME
jgi:hypothetical protein